jgi:hypothetical protein
VSFFQWMKIKDNEERSTVIIYAVILSVSYCCCVTPDEDQSNSWKMRPKEISQRMNEWHSLGMKIRPPHRNELIFARDLGAKSRPEECRLTINSFGEDIADPEEAVED